MMSYPAITSLSPPGQNTLAVYAFDRKLDGPYVDGRKLLDGEIDSQVLALSAARFFQVGSTTLAGVAVIPWSNSLVSPAPLAAALGKQAKGMGDLRLGLTTWLINDTATANYLGMSGMLITPTGDYDARQSLNSGENRWRYVLFAGWQKDITPGFLIEFSPEIAWYGVNDDYVGNRKFEQRTSYALTGYLRCRISPALHVHLGVQVNPANNERLMAGMSFFLPEQQQLILRVAQDSDIDNGFRTGREIVLRYQKGF